MEIREADNSDSSKIKELVFGVLHEYGLKPDPGATDKDLDELESSYRNNNGYFGVVEEEGNIIASMGLYRMSDTTCELRKMYSLPSARGKGLGRLLVEIAIEKAKALGFEEIILETAAPLKEAISLYKNMGFTEYEPDHMSPRCDQAFKLKL